MRPTSEPLLLLALLAPLATGLAGCGGGGGGGGGGRRTVILESEPNNTFAFSNLITVGTSVKGDLSFAGGDEDWFNVRLFKGRLVRIEVFGTRRDQATWDAAGTVPRLTVFFPANDSKFLEHSASSGWTFGDHDFDVPLFYVEQTGGYWIVVKPDDDLATGGSYVLRVDYVTASATQLEIEAGLDTGVDDTPGTAQTVHAGRISGFHKQGNLDYYAVSVPGQRVVRAEIFAQRNGAFLGQTTPYDALLRLYDASGQTLLAENDDAFFSDPAIQHHVTGGGNYLIQVSENPASTVGAPYLLLLSVDPSPATAESEPNDAFGSADPLAYGGGVSGAIGPGLEDWFRFNGQAGDMVRLQVFDSANSQAASAPVDVELVGPDGITPLSFGVGPEFQVLTTILPANGAYFVRVQPDATAPAPTAYRLELRKFRSATQESEPNDTVAEADAFTASDTVAGTISTPGDRDIFRLTTGTDELVILSVYAGNASTGSDGFSEYSGHGSDLDPLLTLRDSTGAVVATSTSLPAGSVYTESVSDGLPTAALTFVGPPTSHVFFIEVTDADASGTSASTYVIERR